MTEVSKEVKSRVKVQVKGFGSNHQCVVLGQVKIGFFYETIYQREVIRGGAQIDSIIQQAKDAIAAYKAAGFDVNGEIEV